MEIRKYEFYYWYKLSVLRLAFLTSLAIVHAEEAEEQRLAETPQRTPLLRVNQQAGNLNRISIQLTFKFIHPHSFIKFELTDPRAAKAAQIRTATKRSAEVVG